MIGTKINSPPALFTLHAEPDLTVGVNTHFMPSGLCSAQQENNKMKINALVFY